MIRITILEVVGINIVDATGPSSGGAVHIATPCMHTFLGVALSQEPRALRAYKSAWMLR